jgi:hypothetical protein
VFILIRLFFKLLACRTLISLRILHFSLEFIIWRLYSCCNRLMWKSRLFFKLNCLNVILKMVIIVVLTKYFMHCLTSKLIFCLRWGLLCWGILFWLSVNFLTLQLILIELYIVSSGWDPCISCVYSFLNLLLDFYDVVFFLFFLIDCRIFCFERLNMKRKSFSLLISKLCLKF